MNLRLMDLIEHAGWMRAHDPHVWWIFDSRETSPKTCPLCLSFHGTHYRGDEIDTAFPRHIHLRVNAIKCMVHPHCRCLLRWTGRSKDVLEQPYGYALKRAAKMPTIPKRQEPKLSPSQKREFKRVAKIARETWRKRVIPASP